MTPVIIVTLCVTLLVMGAGASLSRRAVLRILHELDGYPELSLEEIRAQTGFNRTYIAALLELCLQRGLVQHRQRVVPAILHKLDGTSEPSACYEDLYSLTIAGLQEVRRSMNNREHECRLDSCLTRNRADVVVGYARAAKRYMQNAGTKSMPSDELIIRAAWAYDMLQRTGVLTPLRDDLDRPHSIATIASNFHDQEPEHPGRAAMFSRRLDP